MGGLNPYGDRLLTDFPSAAASVTPTNTTTTSNVLDGSRFLMVGVSGNVAVIMKDGQTVTLPNLAAGVWHRVQISHVLLTGTTATGIVAGL